MKVLFFPQLPVRMTHATMENALKPSIATNVFVLMAFMERSVSTVRKYNDVLVSGSQYFKSLTVRT